MVCFLPGWLVHRFRWYMAIFNIANYALAGLAAHEIVRQAGFIGADWSPAAGSAAALAAASVAFVAINHTLIVFVVTLARGRSLRNSAEDMLGSIPMDLALALTGACLAALWVSAPALALLAVGPMVLVYRALWVPLLEHQSRTDSKTGLYSSEYLTSELESALACAKRDDSGLSLVMIDLDQLRGINNRHGHLAGDKVIRAVAEVVSEAAGAHDGIAARFGGDELCLLLPGKSLDPATEIAEDVRTRIGDIRLTFKGSHGPLAVTASVGIASYPEHAATVESLLAAADVAVYDAKLGGRNRTRMPLPSDLREALKLEAEERASHHDAPAALGDAEDPVVTGHAAEEAPAPVAALAERRRPLAVWRERLARMVPHYLDRSRETVTELEMSNDELEAANMRLLQLLEENRQLLGRMQRSYLSTITSLARTAEAKDPYTGGHTERVAEIALLLARELGFDESELPAIKWGRSSTTSERWAHRTRSCPSRAP